MFFKQYIHSTEQRGHEGVVRRDGTPPRQWSDLQSSVLLANALDNPRLHRFLTCASVTLSDGERASVGTWVLTSSEHEIIRVGRILEIIQVYGTQPQLEGRANAVLVELYQTTETCQAYMLPRLVIAGRELVKIKVCAAVASSAMHSLLRPRTSCVQSMCNTTVHLTTVTQPGELPCVRRMN